MSVSPTLKDEFEYYLAHQDKMVEKYDGNVIVIKNHKVLGEYDSELAAFTETIKFHEKGSFIIQRVSEGTEAYTATYNTSRVTFP